MTTYLYFLPYHKILKDFPETFSTEINWQNQDPTQEKRWGIRKRKKSEAFPRTSEAQRRPQSADL